MPGISLLKQKYLKIVAPTSCGLSLFPLDLYGEPWDEGKSYPTAKTLLISPILEKSPLADLNLWQLKVSFLLYQTAIFK